jgi:hypothetical protein
MLNLFAASSHVRLPLPGEPTTVWDKALAADRRMRRFYVLIVCIVACQLLGQTVGGWLFDAAGAALGLASLVLCARISHFDHRDMRIAALGAAAIVGANIYQLVEHFT